MTPAEMPLQGCRPGTSEVGTDIRAVRVCGGVISAAFCVCGRGAFGEIAPPRRDLGEVGFSVTRM